MVHANYFDGRSTRVRAVNLSVAGEDLIIDGEDVNFRVPFADVKVDERLGRAPRRLRLKDGTFCEVRDLDALDTLLLSTSHRDGWVDRMQRHLQFVLFSIVALPPVTLIALDPSCPPPLVVTHTLLIVTLAFWTWICPLMLRFWIV